MFWVTPIPGKVPTPTPGAAPTDVPPLVTAPPQITPTVIPTVFPYDPSGSGGSSFLITPQPDLNQDPIVQQYLWDASFPADWPFYGGSAGYSYSSSSGILGRLLRIPELLLLRRLRHIQRP